MFASKRAISLLLLAGLRLAHGDSSQPLFARKLNAHAARAVTGQSNIVGDHHYLFTHVSVGDSQDLELIVSTRTPALMLNPGRYKPSAKSVDAKESFVSGSSELDLWVPTSWKRSVILQAHAKIFNDAVFPSGNPGLTVPQQSVGVTQSFENLGFLHDGIFGLTRHSVQDPFNQNSFMENLCNQGTISSCRFGIALRTDLTGNIFYGAVPTDLLANPIVSVAAGNSWYLYGKTSVSLNDKTIDDTINLTFDTAIPVIYGPADKVMTLFQNAGVKLVPFTGGVAGYYDCRAPPKIGFTIAGRTFNIAPEALALMRDGDNCTASIMGSTKYGDWWQVGHPFFQGRYVDHDLQGHRIGFADLK
ncbi:hypothetical protein E4U53_006863 [Claviceps sorghi]|nr:hypothetical protein E4U53_006863 [Claviceps sorghi]